MKIKSATILGVPTAYPLGEEQLLPGFNDEPTNTSSSLLRVHIPSGAILRMTALASHSQLLPMFWKEKIEESYVPLMGERIRIAQVIAEEAESLVCQDMKSVGNKVAQRWDTLMMSFSTDEQKYLEPVSEPNYVSRFSCVFLLEPEEELWGKDTVDQAIQNPFYANLQAYAQPIEGH